ncbi:MAG: hypothetical protein K2W91_13055 [Novosphingobium sp.]|nr:hypothetical protein [Novosphingobium sp.]
MLKKSIIASLAAMTLLGATPVQSQGIGHTWFMRGSIVQIDSKGIVVCIGKADGAEVGQTLDVYRIMRHPGPRKSPGSDFHRQEVGEVRIVHVFDDHFAHVTVIKGKPARNDIVELKRDH